MMRSNYVQFDYAAIEIKSYCEFAQFWQKAMILRRWRYLFWTVLYIEWTYCLVSNLLATCCKASIEDKFLSFSLHLFK